MKGIPLRDITFDFNNGDLVYENFSWSCSLVLPRWKLQKVRKSPKISLRPQIFFEIYIIMIMILSLMCDSFYHHLRVSRSLIWHILDKILAKHGFKDIIQISQFVELAFILRKPCVKTFLHEYTPRHISETGRPKPKLKFYLLWSYILK